MGSRSRLDTQALGRPAPALSLVNATGPRADGADASLSPRRRGDVRDEMLPDGSVVLYDPRAEMGHALSESAALVWELCDGSRAAPSIAQALADRYDAPLDVILADVKTLFQALDAAGLLASSSGAAL